MPGNLIDCADIRDDIDLCAIGTLSSEDDDRVRAHAAECPECEALLASASNLAATLALTAPLRRAPASMRTATLAAIRGPVSSAPAPSTEKQAGRLRRLVSGGWTSGLAAALLLAPVAGLLVWAAILQHQVNDLKQSAAVIQRRNDGLVLFAVPSSIKADFQPGAAATDAVGAVTWNPERHACYVLFDRLPKPDPGTDYRLWYVVDGGQRVVDAGELPVDDTGRADATIDTRLWRGQRYDMFLRLEQRPHDGDAPTVMWANLSRQ
jgi:hypothetical protein